MRAALRRLVETTPDITLPEGQAALHERIGVYRLPRGGSSCQAASECRDRPRLERGLLYLAPGAALVQRLAKCDLRLAIRTLRAQLIDAGFASNLGA